MEGSMHTLLTLPFNSRFFGADRHSRRGGRGEKWSGDACVAHGGTGAKQQGNRTPGDPRIPTLPPCHPRPYEANPLPCPFHKIPTLESPQPGAAGSHHRETVYPGETVKHLKHLKQ